MSATPAARPSDASATPSHHRGPRDVAITVEGDDTPHIQASLYAPHRHASERDVDFDHDVLHRGVRDAGRWAYGTVLVEVWVWNDHKTKLFRPPGGWWLDPIFHQQQHETLQHEHDGRTSATITTLTPREDCALCRLTDKTLDNFLPAQPLAIGEGLPGVLWAELEGVAATDAAARAAAPADGPSKRRSSMRDLRKAGNERPLVWRKVHTIANDPDQPYNPRLQLLAQHKTASQVGWAAAVKFDAANGGLVMYLARAGVSLSRLRYPTNEQYLRQAAGFIGAAYALRKPRQACVTLRQEELHSACDRVKKKIRLIGRQAIAAKVMASASGAAGSVKLDANAVLQQQQHGTMTEDDEGAVSKASCQDSAAFQFIHTHTIRILKKLRGGRGQPPPGFAWIQTAWTFSGVFLTLLMLTRTNKWFVQTWGLDHAIVLGPFGALMTLMYGLTAAPASQPRNALLGQTISMAIAIGVSKIPSMEAWIKQSLATALAVTVMVKLGITHPPAGAAALLFATGKFGWYNVLACLIGNVMAIAAATLINDVNVDRQYPSYWGINQYKEQIEETIFRYAKVRHHEDKGQEEEEEELELPEMSKKA